MNSTSTRHLLAHREILALTRPGGFTVECAAGELWITADGVAGDLLLRAGERVRLEGSPRIVVSALRPASIAATTPIESLRPRRYGLAAADMCMPLRRRAHRAG